MAAEVHIGDVGTLFKPRFLDEDGVVINIAAATVKQVVFQKPDGTVLTKTATLFTDGTDGIAQYVSVAGDLDVAGFWSIEGYVEIPSGKWHSDIHQFPVKANLG